MDWRQWLYNVLSSSAGVLALVPIGQIHASGSLEGRITARPFIVIRFGLDNPELMEADAPLISSQEATIWCHDEPGSYKKIDSVLDAVRTALVGQVVHVDAIACRWLGNSGELADPSQGTIVRNATFRLVGRA